jgi:hypothetical protein
MPTKAEVIAYANDVLGLDVDGSMTKADIEAAIYEAGYDPNDMGEDDMAGGRRVRNSRTLRRLFGRSTVVVPVPSERLRLRRRARPRTVFRAPIVLAGAVVGLPVATT